MLDIVRLDCVVGDADLDCVVDRSLDWHEELEQRDRCGTHPEAGFAVEGGVRKVVSRVLNRGGGRDV